MDIENRLRDGIKFLKTLHGYEPRGGFFLARRNRAEIWEERRFEAPHQADLFIYDAIRHKMDLYFSVRHFDLMGSRSNHHAKPSQWLYADVDDAPWPPNPYPTLWWKTSENMRQALWRTDRLIPSEEQDLLNKRLTYHIGADKGGWHGSKLLRLPRSYNLKRDCWVGPVWEGVVEWDVDDLDQMLTPLYSTAVGTPEGGTFTELSTEEWRSYIRENFDDIPNHILSELLTPTTDRSLKIWIVARECREAGISPVDTCHLISGAEWNKWRGQPARLYRDVQKAYN